MSAPQSRSNNINIPEGPDVPADPSSSLLRERGSEEAASRVRRPAAPAACGGCDARWTGQRAAHCSACHRTFSGAELFDRHRSADGPHGQCVNPESFPPGIAELRDGMWRGPAVDSASIAASIAAGAEQ